MAARRYPIQALQARQDLTPAAVPLDAFIAPNLRAEAPNVLNLAPFSKALAQHLTKDFEKKYAAAAENAEGFWSKQDAKTKALIQGRIDKATKGAKTPEEYNRRWNIAFRKLYEEGIIDTPMAHPGAQLGLLRAVAHEAIGNVRVNSLERIAELSAVRDENGDLAGPANTDAAVDEEFKSLLEARPGLANSFYATQVFNAQLPGIKRELSENVRHRRNVFAQSEKERLESVELYNGDAEGRWMGLVHFVDLTAEEQADPAPAAALSEVIAGVEEHDPNAYPRYFDEMISKAVDMGSRQVEGDETRAAVAEDGYAILAMLEDMKVHSSNQPVLEAYPELAGKIQKAEDAIADKKSQRELSDIRDRDLVQREAERSLSLWLESTRSESIAAGDSALTTAEKLRDAVAAYSALGTIDLSAEARTELKLWGEQRVNAISAEKRLPENKAYEGDMARRLVSGEDPAVLEAEVEADFTNGDINKETYDAVLGDIEGRDERTEAIREFVRTPATEDTSAYYAQVRRLYEGLADPSVVLEDQRRWNALESQTIARASKLQVDEVLAFSNAPSTYAAQNSHIDRLVKQVEVLQAEDLLIRGLIGQGGSFITEALERLRDPTNPLGSAAKNALMTAATLKEANEATMGSVLSGSQALAQEVAGFEGELGAPGIDVASEALGGIVAQHTQELALLYTTTFHETEGTAEDKKAAAVSAIRKHSAERTLPFRDGQPMPTLEGILARRLSEELSISSRALKPDATLGEMAKDAIEAGRTSKLLTEKIYEYKDKALDSNLGPDDGFAFAEWHPDVIDRRFAWYVGAEILLSAGDLEDVSKAEAATAGMGLANRLSLYDLTAGKVTVETFVMPEWEIEFRQALKKGDAAPQITADKAVDRDQWLRFPRISPHKVAGLPVDLSVMPQDVRRLLAKAPELFASSADFTSWLGDKGFTVSHHSSGTPESRLHISRTFSLQPQALKVGASRFITSKKDFEAWQTATSEADQRRVFEMLGFLKEDMKTPEGFAQQKARFLASQRALIAEDPLLQGRRAPWRGWTEAPTSITPVVLPD